MTDREKLNKLADRVIFGDSLLNKLLRYITHYQRSGDFSCFGIFDRELRESLGLHQFDSLTNSSCGL